MLSHCTLLWSEINSFDLSWVSSIQVSISEASEGCYMVSLTSVPSISISYYGKSQRMLHKLPSPAKDLSLPQLKLSEWFLWWREITGRRKPCSPDTGTFAWITAFPKKILLILKGNPRGLVWFTGEDNMDSQAPPLVWNRRGGPRLLWPKYTKYTGLWWLHKPVRSQCQRSQGGWAQTLSRSS